MWYVYGPTACIIANAYLVEQQAIRLIEKKRALLFIACFPIVVPGYQGSTLGTLAVQQRGIVHEQRR
ncbi:hypothetical protein KDH_28140 [Dictyobacter sp. S3.2.2.5]|uniref:Uncharacterized protein n=1 Tax=Dictyobacter halimunensis TaxID=3026934 RepID=A0ABQ6FQJ6_9CHLR|nr:hypothetical protein KDH_28140 [Dictyobacter sp. S3.2.2.5]